MKKFLTVLSIILLIVIWYLLYTLNQLNNKLSTTETWDYETIISQLENELSIKTEELSDLQSENQVLKDTLSWTMDMLNSLQVEKSGVANSLSWCENKLEKYLSYIEKLVEANNLNAWNNNTNNTSNNNSSNSSTDTANWKEVWMIKQVYHDEKWNRKIEIDYVQLLNWINCGAPETSTCIVNDDPTLRTFTVSDDVQIFTFSIEGYREDKKVSFDYFEQKFNDNDTHYYDGYSYNYSNYFKNIPFRITIENNIVVKINEEYMP